MSKTKLGIATAIGAAALLTTSTDLIPEFEVQRPVNTAAMLDVSVTIKTISHVTIDRVGDSVWEAGSGSGFLVSADKCELWTAQHVIKDAAIIEIFPRGWEGTQGIAAYPVNATPRPDVAVLRMEHCDGLAVAPLGESSALKAGDETYAVGNPLGLNPDSISRGIVSHTERYLKGSTAFVQTDAAINPGNSGGPLFNRRGEVVGMNTAIASTTGKNIGIGYAVPINLVRKTVEALHAGPPQWGDARLDSRLGTLTRDEARMFRLPRAQGAAIVTVTPESGPAAGKLYARDVIYRIGNQAVSDSDEALRAISTHDAGSEVAFDLVRNGQHRSVLVKLENGWEANEERAPATYKGTLGMDVEMWPTDEQGKTFENPVITKVHSLGPAHRAHISSSQRNIAMRGRAVIPYQMDVKTITGLVFEGTYHPIEDVETLNDFATKAEMANTPLLLEVQLWGRRNQNAIHEAMEHITTAFFRVHPQASEKLSEAELEFSAELDTSNMYDDAQVSAPSGDEGGSNRILAAAHSMVTQ